MIRLRRVSRFEDIGAKAWAEVLGASGENYIFQTYEFMSAWWEYFGLNQKNRELLLLVVEDGASLVGIAPLMLRKIAFVNLPVIQFIGTDICDYMNFIIKDIDYERYLSKILEYLAGLGFLEIDLKYISGDWKMREKSDGIAQANNLCGRISRLDACPYIDLQKKWQELMPGIKKRLKDEIKRQEDRLRKKGNLVFKTYQKEQDIAGLLDDYFNLHIKKWRDSDRRYSQFQYGHWKGFVTELARLLSDRGWLDVSYLELDKKMIACHFGFVYNGRLYYYMPTFDPDLAAYSPAKILIMKMLERSHKNGLKEFDFLRGEEAYKLAWTDRSRPLYGISYYPKKAPMRYLGLFYKLATDGYLKNIKPAVKRMKPLMSLWYSSRGDRK